MKYALLVYESPEAVNARNDPALAPAYWASYMAYSKALAEAGVAAGGAGLQAPAMGTTLRIRGDQRQVQDGPFADTKEQLGGFFLVDVPDLDAALKWAARCPSAANGSVEVRPVLPPPDQLPRG
ncbi:MAG: YciI family protein [Planctomycetaceae bacterium]|nr:YciI family protein [Planctomycetaceae bacterium]